MEISVYNFKANSQQEGTARKKACLCGLHPWIISFQNEQSGHLPNFFSGPEDDRQADPDGSLHWEGKIRRSLARKVEGRERRGQGNKTNFIYGWLFFVVL